MRFPLAIIQLYIIAMTDMHTDLSKMLQETIELVRDVKVNKKLCRRLDSKIKDMLDAVRNLQKSNIKLSPVIYHNLVSLLLDVKAFLKKSAVKSLLGNFQKSKIQNEFNCLNQRLTDIMMDEPRLLPDNATEAGRARLAPPAGERTMTGHNTKRSTMHSSTSPFLFEESIVFSSKLTSNQLIQWLVGCTALPENVLIPYATLFLSSGLSSLAALHHADCSEPGILIKLGIAEEHAPVVAGAIGRAVERRSSRVLSDDGLLPTYEMAMLDETVSTSTDEKQELPRGKHAETLISNSSRQLLALTVESSMSGLTNAITQNDETLAVAALSAVADMTEGSEENQRAYGNAGVCDVVVLLLVEMCWSEAVCEVSLRAVCWLSRHGTGRHTSSAKNILALGDAGACRAVVSAIDVHEENEDVLFWGCRAIMNLSSNVQNNMRLGEDGACTTVVRTLGKYGERTGLQNKHWTDGGDFSLQIWGALINISLTPLNNAKLAEAGAVQAMVAVWGMNVSCRNIALWACMATQNMALNDTSRETLGLCGGCALVVDALKRFSTDSEIAAQAFMAIQNLTNNHTGNNTSLGQAGACEVVVKALQVHINDEAVAQRGCMALMNLSHNHDSNRDALVTHGISVAISEALKLHPDSASVAEFAFGVLVNLTEADWRVCSDQIASQEISVVSELGSSDICDGLVSVLQTHCEDTNCEVVAELGCWAIRNLCFGSMELKTIMGALGAAEAVCKCLSTHMGIVAVAEMASWAISVLADNHQPNSYRLGTAGACADIVRLLQLQCHVDSVVELGCMAIQSLALSCERNRRLLADLDAFAVVMKIVKDHHANEHIESLGLRTLSSLSRHDEVEETALSIASTYNTDNALKTGKASPVISGSGEQQHWVVGEKLHGVDGLPPEVLDLEDSALLQLGKSGTDDSHDEADADQDDEGEGDDPMRRAGSTDSDVIMRANSYRIHHNSVSGTNWDDKILGLSSRITVGVEEALAVLRTACTDDQSEMYVAAALSLTARLAEGRGGVLQKSLGQGGACELIADVMIPMLKSEIVCRHGLEAICWLSRYGNGKETSNEDNVDALGMAGLCEIVVEAGSLHSASDIQQGSELCLWCCRAITNLASNEVNSRKLGVSGACAVVLLILRNHYDIVVAQSKKGSYVGTGKLMDVVKQGWGAVINLALLEGNNIQFGNEGGCECVVLFMEIWRETPVDILMFLLIGVQNLALIELNRDRLTRTNVCSLIVSILAVYVEKIGSQVGAESILEYGCMAIQKLALNRVHSDCIGEHGGCKVVITILRKLPDHLGIQELGGLAVMNLSSESESNAARLIECDTFACLNLSISNFTDVTGGEPVVEYALTALNNIARTCGARSREAMTESCIEKIVAAIKVCYRRAKGSRDVSNLLVIEQSCFLIMKLSSEDQSRDRINSFGVKNALSKIIREFQDGSPKLSTLARSTLKSLLRGSTITSVSDEKGSAAIEALATPEHSMEADEDVIEMLEAESQLSAMVLAEMPLSSGGLCPASPNQEIIDVRDSSVSETIHLLRMSLEIVNNEMNVASCLFRVSRVAEGNAERQSELGRQGSCADVVRALRTYISSAIVCENGLRAVCFLSRHGQDKSTANDYNNSIFGEVELPKLLVRIMNAWHDNEKVCFFGCKAVMNLGSDDVLNAELGEMGACEAVVVAIKNFFGLDNILKQGLWALINLALNDRNNKRFKDIGCDVVMTVLKMCVDKNDLASWALMAVQNLGIRKDNRIQLGELGACELVVAALNEHMLYSPVVEYGCMAIEKLVLEPANSIRAGRCGACEAVLGAISCHNEDDMIAELGWKAVHRLAKENYENCRRLSAAHVADIAVCAFQRHFNDEEVMEQILVAVGILALEPPMPLTEQNFTNGTNSVILRLHDDIVVNVPLKNELGSVGICELLVRMLNLYTSDEAIMRASQGQSDNIGIVYLLLNAIASLATDSSTNRQIFGDSGACEKTIAAMTLHLGSEDIAAKGCAVVLALSTGNKVNSLRFSSLGTETVLFRVIRKNNLSKKVISAGFSALTTVFGMVAEDATSALTIDPKKAHRSRRKSAIVDNTASFDIVIKILNIHQHSKNITVSGCQLLHALIVASVAVGSGEILADLLPGSGSGKVIKLSPNSFLGIAQTLVRSISLFPNSSRVCRLVCMTMSEVAVELTCSATLGSLGACESVVSCLKRYIDFDSSSHDTHVERDSYDDSNSIAVVKYALRAIYCLAAEDSNMQRLRSCHAGSYVVNAIKCFSRNEGIVKAGCLSVFALLQERLHRREIMLCDGYQCLVGCVKTFQSNPLIVEYGLTSLSRLLVDSENVTVIGAGKTSRLVVAMMKRYCNYFAIVKICCGVIVSLCVDDECQKALGAAGADEALLRALQQYADDENMAEMCCIAISRLGYANKSICSSSVPCGQDLGSALLDMLVNHSENRSLVVNSLGVITSMVNIFPEMMLRFCGHDSADVAEESGRVNFFHTILVTVLDRHLHDPSIVDSAMGLVKNYVINCPDDLQCLFADSSGVNRMSELEGYMCLSNVVASLNEYIDHEDVVGNCVGIIDAMLSFSVEHRLHADIWYFFEVEGLCECLLVNCLERYMSTYYIALYCCRITKHMVIISRSSSGRSRILQDLAMFDVSGIIMDALQTYRSMEDGFIICAECCAALDAMCEISTEENVSIGRKGYSSCAVEMLSKYTSASIKIIDAEDAAKVFGSGDMRHRLIITALCRSLSILVCVEENRNILLDLGICDIVGPILLAYRFDSAIAESCCRMVLHLSSEEDTAQHLGQVSVCEGVVSALGQHMKEASVVKCASWACMNLSVEDENIVRLYDAGACGPLLEVLSRYSDDVDICEHALGAIVNLADRNDDSKSALCAGNVLTIVMNLLKQSASVTILEMTFMIIVNLSDDQHRESVAALTNSELFALVIKHMREHEHNAVIVEQGCWAIRNLSLGNIENAVDWGRLGACEVVLNCMRLHFIDSQSVAVQGCAAIACLLGMDNHGSLTRPNIKQLTDLGGFGTMTLAMSVHRTDEEVVENSCVAISRYLSFYSDEETDYIERHLDRIRLIHESISEALLSHFVNDIISERCCQILSDIYSRDQCELGRIRDWTSCCDGVVSALQTHYMLENVALESTLLMRLLARHSKEAQCLIGLTGGSEKVVTALLYYTKARSPRGAYLRVMCLDLILALCNDCDVIIGNLGEYGACEAIVDSLQCVLQYLEDSGTDGTSSYAIESVASCCKCIVELSRNTINRNKFLAGGAVSALSYALASNSLLCSGCPNGDCQSSGHYQSMTVSGGDDEDVSLLTVCNLCCAALFALCVPGIDDITLFGGTDLPFTLIKRLSQLSPHVHEVNELQSNICAWDTLSAHCLRIIKFILSMRHSRKRNDSDLQLAAFHLLKQHQCIPTAVAIFSEVVSGELDSEGRAIVSSLPDFITVVESAIACFESSKMYERGSFDDVLQKLHSLLC